MATAARGQPEQHVGQALAVDRRLAPERPQQRLGGAARRSSPRRRPARWAPAGCATSATRLGQDAADADHDGHAELGVVGQPGDELAVAAAPWAPPAPRPRRRRAVAAASSSAAAAAHGVGVAQAEAHQAPLGLVGDARRRTAWPPPGSRARRPPRRRRRPWPRGARPAPGRRGGPAAPSSRPRTGCGWAGRGRRVGHGRRAYSGPSQPGSGPVLAVANRNVSLSDPSQNIRRGGVRAGLERAARKSSRMCSRRASSMSSSSGSRSSRPSMNGQVAEVAEQRAVAGQQELLGVERGSARRPSRGRSSRRPARTAGRRATPRSMPRCSSAVEGLAAHDAHELGVLPEEARSRR